MRKKAPGPGRPELPYKTKALRCLARQRKRVDSRKAELQKAEGGAGGNTRHVGT